MVFDVTDRDSFIQLETWWYYIEPKDFPQPKVIVGNKTDLNDQRVVSKEEAEQFAQTHNAVYLETSATDPDSTRAAFRRAIEVFVGGTAMHGAAWNGNVSKIEEAFDTLGEQSIDTADWQGRTPLHYAALRGHISAIKALVRLGSKAIDNPDKLGRTSLFNAAGEEHVSVIETLVRLGSKAIDIPDELGRTSLFNAAEEEHVSVIEALVRLGSKAIDTPDNSGSTPLHAASSNGHVSVIENTCSIGKQGHRYSQQLRLDSLVLGSLERPYFGDRNTCSIGSNAIDISNNNGCTPMHEAARYGQVLTIELLVRLGSKAIDTPNNKGQTPLQLVPARKPECGRVLQALSANPTSPIEVRGKTIELTEEEVVEVRYRVYFGESLTHRLLFGGALSFKDVHSSTIRIDPAVQ